MGELIGGTWHRSGVEAVLSEGILRRPPSVFRNWIVAHGETGAGRVCFEPNTTTTICTYRSHVLGPTAR